MFGSAPHVSIYTAGHPIDAEIRDYRGKGICTKLMNNLVEYGKNIGLGRIDLSATDEGYPIYAKVGFMDKEHRYRDMLLKF